jgi:hypothetical protein
MTSRRSVPQDLFDDFGVVAQAEQAYGEEPITVRSALEIT